MASPAHASLQRTNMTAADMIPDTFNPQHDERFWCVPKLHDSKTDGDSGGSPLYLVTQGHKVGIWHNWTVVKAMVSGYQHSAYRGHRTVEGCIEEWQEHCRLGVHPHPVDPQFARDASRESPKKKSLMTPVGVGRPVENQLQMDLKKYCMPILPDTSHRVPVDRVPVDDHDSISACSSLTLSSLTLSDDIPAPARYFALWDKKVVYTDHREARRALEIAEAAGAKPSIVSTDLYEEALAFAEGVHWVED
ncbi:hypothetical protein C8R45DRAFT_1113691 [Mycena sanguinolenta]|nr:hypothetical protein C8R45DRAFT_1113691 [Mycena sanguinolenta]